MSTNQIPLEHINLEYLSGVNVTEDAQCLLDISNNQNTITNNAQQQQQQQQHTHPPIHQSLAAQHIQQFKIEYDSERYPNDDGEYAEEEEVVPHCAVEVETVHAIEENSSINSFDGHNVNAATIGSAVAQTAAAHSAQAAVESKASIYHQYNGSIALVSGSVAAAAATPSITTATSLAAHVQPIKRSRHEAMKNGSEDLSDVISAAVDYFKMQTAVADADAAFAKYILEEVRQMSKKRKNEFKRKVTTWLTAEDDTTGLE